MLKYCTRCGNIYPTDKIYKDGKYVFPEHSCIAENDNIEEELGEVASTIKLNL